MMAMIAMLVLVAGSSTYAYITNKNLSNSGGTFHDNLQAQYSAEAAVRVAYVTGQESMKGANGYAGGNAPSALDNWSGQTETITLPGNNMGGGVEVMVINTGTNTYTIQARSTLHKTTRVAYYLGVDLLNQTHQVIVTNPVDVVVTAASLINSALNTPGGSWSNQTGKNPYQWQLPSNLLDQSSPAKSPGSGTGNAWSTISSQLLFTDVLGYSDFTPSPNLQLLFRVNYYVELTNVPSSQSSGSGYGIYYLAQESTGSTTVNAGDPTSYVVQFDPGLHPGFGAPPTDNTGDYATSTSQSDQYGWGAAFGSNDTGVGNATNWPYGAFLVKKVVANGTNGPQNEVWDEGGSYPVQCAFQDNNELAQHYYKNNGSTYSIPTLSLTKPSTWALKPLSTTPGLNEPVETRVPTVFGPDLTGNYRVRPPDLQIAYTLGDIAEGNPWQANTYYPAGAKVAVGVWVDDAIDKRMVWVAQAAGVSGSSQPSQLSVVPTTGTTVTDNQITWVAQLAPTPEMVANSILNNNNFSIARISMSDLSFRLNAVNGTISSASNLPYSIPFSMVQGNQNKISIELWTDTNGNRIQVIRVNDVVVLGFNDRYASGKNNIIPQGWELNPSKYPRGTGIRVWDAAAEFFTADNYGQTISTTTTNNETFTNGTWGN